jgi:heme exporter protein C
VLSVRNTPLRHVLGRLESAGLRSACTPRGFYPAIGVLLPWVTIAAGASCALGLYLGIFAAPHDARHGSLFPVVVIHVAAAWMSAGLFLLLAFWAGAGLLLGARLFAMMAQALAPTGAMFALMSLSTGTLWSRPTWGTWWDARLAVELVLFLLYVAIIAFRISVENPGRADRISALLALAGLAFVPGVLASAASWQAFHVSATGAPAHPWSSLGTGLPALVAGFWM